MKFTENDNYVLYQGKMQDVIDNELKEKSVDCIVTDPPYELNFMNKGWDNSGVAFQKETWEKCLKVLKPGGYLLAFGGTRTYHRIACAIEDAGFEIRDCIMWLYGSGFPKSMNLGLKMDKKQGCPDRGHRIAVANRCHPDGTIEPNGENLQPYEPKTELGEKWNGWGTALKPAYEPVIVARKPFTGSLVDNVLEYGVGGLNIEECRVGNDLIKGGSMPKMNSQSDGINIYNFGKENAERLDREDNIGRFPANVILTYDETDQNEVCGGFPDTKSEGGNAFNKVAKNGENSMFGLKQMKDDICFHDEGSAARYFYCAKASKKDRDNGLDEFEEKRKAGYGYDFGYMNAGEGMFKDRETLKRNTHPTVKPVDLMQYLIRLVAPQNAVILDPFMGSGSTGKAAMFENRERNKNYKFIGIEMTEEYLPICKARIDYAIYKYEYELKMEKKKDEENGIQSIFDYIEEK